MAEDVIPERLLHDRVDARTQGAIMYNKLRQTAALLRLQRLLGRLPPPLLALLRALL